MISSVKKTFAIVILALVPSVTGLIDLTRLPGASGEVVVKATLSRIHESCLFKNDYLFLYRLAYVVSNYGTQPLTYRSGFEGGIWQISKNNFNASLSIATTDLDNIKNTFNITWADTNWSDLRKPLYSGIAAILTLQQSGANIPKDIQGQANFYQTYMSGNASYFQERVTGLNIDCGTDNLDMAFLLDSSGSIDPVDFEKSKNFTANVIAGFSVGYDKVRVAVTSFSDSFTEQFGFLKHNSGLAAKNETLRIKKIAGGTNTGAALDKLRTSVFTTSRGARQDSAKIAIVQTDGKSNDKVVTVEAARKLKESGVIIFAIGLGSGIDEEELKAIASPPFCTHVRLLDNFTELDSIVSEIKDVACKTVVVQEVNTTNTYTCSGQNTIKVELTSNISIFTRPQFGKVNIYGSFEISQPNYAFADFSDIADDSRPTVFYVTDTVKPLYLGIEANIEEDVCNSTYLVKVVKTSLQIKTSLSILCIKKNQIMECTDEDFVKSGNFTEIKPGSEDTLIGVCLGELKGFRRHPESKTKYIYCKPGGGTYEVNCPDGFAYHHLQKDCIIPSNKDDICQVCTAENWEIGIRNFPISEANRHQFVECTGVRDCRLQSCPEDFNFVPDNQTCSDRATPDAGHFQLNLEMVFTFTGILALVISFVLALVKMIF